MQRECAVVRSANELLAYRPWAYYLVVLLSRGMLRDPGAWDITEIRAETRCGKHLFLHFLLTKQKGFLSVRRAFTHEPFCESISGLLILNNCQV